MSKKVIKVAAREKRRMVNAAVGKNFLKTVTEPLTNSDSILKKRDGVPHSAGLVDELLKLKRDQRIDTSELKKLVPKARFYERPGERLTTKTISVSDSVQRCENVCKGLSS
jgi:hypothetical protein